MTKEERMTEIAKASPNFGKRVGYKMCVVDELHDMKELLEENKYLIEDNNGTIVATSMNLQDALIMCKKIEG